MVLFISFSIFFSHVLWAWSKVFHSPFFFRIGPGTFSPFSHGQSAPRGLSTDHRLPERLRSGSSWGGRKTPKP